MTEKKILPKMPWKWFILGIAIQLIGSSLFMGYQWTADAASNYNRARNIPDDFYDDGFFLSALMLFGLIPAFTSFGRKIGPDKYALLYTFWNLSWSTAWTARLIPVAALSWYKDPKLSAVMFPSYFSIPKSEITKFLVGGTPDLNAILPVLTWWTTFALALAFTNYFLAIIFRRQLIDIEKLPFPWQIPTVELIKTITSPVSESSGKKGGILKEKILWYAFGAAWLLYIWDILRVLSLGAIPRLPLRNYTAEFGTPYADLTPTIGGVFTLSFNLPDFLVLIAFIPVDILFSIFVWQFGWYTVWAAIGQAVGIYPRTSQLGWRAVEVGIGTGWDFPKLRFLDNGVLLGIAIYFLWNSRDHLRNVLGALRGRKELDDPGLSYKIAVPAFIVCLLALWGFWLYAGGYAGWSLLLIVWILIASIGMMRMRGELWRGGNGLGWGNGVYGQWGGLMNVAGLFSDLSIRQSPQMFAMVGMGQWPGRDINNWNDFCIKVPSALKVSNDVGGVDKQIIIAILVGTAIGLPFTTWLTSAIAYAGRTVTIQTESYWSATGVYNGTWLGEFSPIYYIGAFLGFVFMFLEARFAWWPLNPIGVAAVHGGWISPHLTLNIMLAFVAKYLIWKLGGAKIQRTVRLFTIGFLAGYFLKEVISFVVGLFIIGVPNIPPP